MVAVDDIDETLPVYNHREDMKFKFKKEKFNEDNIRKIDKIFDGRNTVEYTTFATFDQFLVYYEFMDINGDYHISANDFYNLTLGQIPSDEQDIVLNDYMYYFDLALEYYNNY